MSEATYVAFVPRAKREKLRHVLRTEDTGSLRCARSADVTGAHSISRDRRNLRDRPTAT